MNLLINKITEAYSIIKQDKRNQLYPFVENTEKKKVNQIFDSFAESKELEKENKRLKDIIGISIFINILFLIKTVLF